MLPIRFPLSGSAPRRILCLGAHSDDIEIGAGGTILQLLSANRNLEFVWVVFSAAGNEREREARRSAGLFLEGANHHEVIVKDFRDGFFPYDGGRVKEFFEELKTRVSPDLIFTHYRDDRHQDHRTICDLTWNTWRNHMILEYEIPKYDGDLGSPNWFVPLRRDICDRKIKHICDIFQTQGKRHGSPRIPFRRSFGFVVWSAPRQRSTPRPSIAASSSATSERSHELRSL
jgi:LmbE family N-acetylglucosaminyl deacetylase